MQSYEAPCTPILLLPLNQYIEETVVVVAVVAFVEWIEENEECLVGAPCNVCRIAYCASGQVCDLQVH